MKYRPLGRTGLDVSVIGLGTMTWGEQNTPDEAYDQLDYALERGVNLIDAAELYPVPPRAQTATRTETIIGNWLTARKNRDRVILATKVTGRSGGLAWLRDGERPCLSRDHIMMAVEGSLKRLQTDYIDLYQIHWPDRATNFFGQLGFTLPEHALDDDSIPIEDQLQTLDDLVRAGKIRFIGLSNETPWGVMRFLELAEKNRWPRAVSIQNPYSLLNRSFEVGLAEVAFRESCGLLAYSPLAFGMLTGKYDGGKQPEKGRLTIFGEMFDRYTKPRGRRAAAIYNRIAVDHGLIPAQMALAYVNSRSFVTSNLIGATTMEQLATNIDSVDLTVPDSVIQAIEMAHAEDTYPCP